jgi:hypothetical protein
MPTKSLVRWQVTGSWDVKYSYNASRSLSINTASLINGVATSLAGTAVILSPAAGAYLAVRNSVVQQITTSIFTAVDKWSDQYHIDVLGHNETGR